MKNKYLFLVGLSIISNLALALDGVIYKDDSIEIDLKKACFVNGAISCDLNEHGIDLKIVGSDAVSNLPGKSIITSSMPIVSVNYSLLTCYKYYSYCEYYYGGKWKDNSYQSYEELKSESFVYTSNNSETFSVSFASKPTAPTRIVLSTGIPVYLKKGLTGASRVLQTSYKGVLRNVTGFKTQIAKSHRGHLDRFTTALKEGIDLLQTVDKDSNPVYSVVDWRVQENARLVVVFGTVLNELLTDYDDVTGLKNSINAMRTLVSQLRLSYGWEKGLAGSVSKASSSLIDVVRLELQELASIKMAMGAEFKPYTEMLKITRNLQAAVDASKSGDMRAQREIFPFVDLWNAKEWQDEMAKLMNAGPDFKNLIIPKLVMLLNAVESIADLADQNFTIPDRKQITSTSEK